MAWPKSLSCAALAIGAAASLGCAAAFTSAPAPHGLFADRPRGLPASTRQLAARGGPVHHPAAPSTGGVLPALAAVAGMSAAVLGIGAVRRGRSDGAAQRGPRTALQALTVIGRIKLTLPAGKATPAPPVGPACGQLGVNIAFFAKEYNAMTSDKMGQTIPCVVDVFSDKSFSIKLRTPPTCRLLCDAAGAEKGSANPSKEPVGNITVDQLREIAKVKLPDLNVPDVTRAMKICHGCAVSCGVIVDGYEEWLSTKFTRAENILDRWGANPNKLPKEGRDIADEGLGSSSEDSEE